MSRSDIVAQVTGEGCVQPVADQIILIQQYCSLFDDALARGVVTQEQGVISEEGSLPRPSNLRAELNIVGTSRAQSAHRDRTYHSNWTRIRNGQGKIRLTCLRPIDDRAKERFQI